MLLDFELSFIIISLSLACIAYFLLVKFKFFYFRRSSAIVGISLLFLQLISFMLVKYLDIPLNLYYLFPFKVLYIYYFSQLIIKDDDFSKSIDYFNFYSFVFLFIGYFAVINDYLLNQFEFHFIHSVVTSLLLIRLLVKYAFQIKNEPIKELKNKWIFQTLIILCIVEGTLFIYSLNTSFSVNSLQVTILAYQIFTNIVLAIFIYRSIKKLQTSLFERKEEKVFNIVSQVEIPEAVKLPSLRVDESLVEKKTMTNQKYSKSRLTFEELQNIRIKLKKIESEQLYLNPELNLDYLSNYLKVPKHTLSQAFSSVYGTNFKDHVNTLRCEYAIKHILNKDSNENIIEIAYLSGYNSKTSFYRAFNKIYNCTPIEFKQKTMN